MKLNFKPLANPILILSDAPDSHTGLARVARDTAGLLASMPEFRVAVLGRGGVGRKRFPWVTYCYPESAQWGEDYIAPVWNDFSVGEAGIIWTNWDLTRLLWYAQPQQGDPLLTFLGEGRTFAKWGYVPVDSTGPDGVRLPCGAAASAMGFDRLVAASDWGRGVLQQTRPDADWIPHGIWMDIFRPVKGAREMLGWRAGDIWVGCNMSNQARKDWPAAFECARELRKEYGNRFHFWAHTDLLVHYWNLYALAQDYEMGDSVQATTGQTDQQLAVRYSACDATILPSTGEGFGFPIAESMACGVACVVTDYAGGTELVQEDCRVKPVAWRVDTQHNVRRAVVSGYGFAEAVKREIERRRGDEGYRAGELREAVKHLDWGRLKRVWSRWMRDGLRGTC